MRFCHLDLALGFQGKITFFFFSPPPLVSTFLKFWWESKPQQSCLLPGVGAVHQLSLKQIFLSVVALKVSPDVTI